VEDEGEEEETETDLHTAVNRAVDDYDGGKENARCFAKSRDGRSRTPIGTDRATLGSRTGDDICQILVVFDTVELRPIRGKAFRVLDPGEQCRA